MSSRTTIEVETVAEAYLALLAARGIDYIFANGGTDFAPIVEAFASLARRNKEAIKCISVGHENVAAAMAHGYYLLTGRPQAVMFHVSVGTANGINQLINAARDQIPLIFTAGRNPLTEYGMRGSRDVAIHWGQEMMDQAGMVRELCKWDYELRNAEQLEAVVDRAIEIATTEPCGPVYLSLPREVLSAPLKTFSFSTNPRRASGAIFAPTAEAIARAAEIIAKAQRPAIITRAAGKVRENVEPLTKFAEAYAIPVIEFTAAANCLGSDHPMHGGVDPKPYVADADVLICIDAMVPWIPTVHGQPRDDCQLLHIAPDPIFSRIPIRSFPCDVALAGPAHLALPALSAVMVAKVSKEQIAQRRERLRQAREGVRASAPKNVDLVAKAQPIHPIWASHCIGEAMGRDPIVINEYTLNRAYANFRKPRTYFGTPSAGGLGWGVGAAIGAKLAAPDRLVIATLGDGSYMFGNPTAGHQVLHALGLPVLFVVFNNAMWEEVERTALTVFPDGHAAKSNRVPIAHLGPHAGFEHVVRAFGGYGERVDEPSELPHALQRALHAVTVEKRQALLNLIVGHR